jgi:hypothetical protein
MSGTVAAMLWMRLKSSQTVALFLARTINDSRKQGSRGRARAGPVTFDDIFHANAN